MSSAFFSNLFSCCIRSRPTADDVHRTHPPSTGRNSADTEQIIPNETSRLLPASAGPSSFVKHPVCTRSSHSDINSSPGLPDAVVVDHQKLQDRLGTIVRSKEGAEGSADTPISPTSPSFPVAPTASSSTTTPRTSDNVVPSRRPPILTMTPAKSQMSLNFSRFSSPSGSRSSSRRRQESNSSGSRHRYSAADSAVDSVAEPAQRKDKASSAWFGESESETSADAEEAEEPPSPAPGRVVSSPIAAPKEQNTHAESIAFSWGDT
ncbi:hypothetical protein C8J57DRAFT_1360009 [Mycena rebaudengoi]|nr:hypothetical protein C8J57DRAFT_1360009 [Mycena rebaudengoi]